MYSDWIHWPRCKKIRKQIDERKKKHFLHTVVLLQELFEEIVSISQQLLNFKRKATGTTEQKVIDNNKPLGSALHEKTHVLMGSSGNGLFFK